MNKYRRKLVALASAGLLAPKVFAAPPSKDQYRIGYLTSGQQPMGTDPFFEIFKKRLQELGYIEGKNIEITPRWAENSDEKLQSQAAELTGLKPDVIVALGEGSVKALKQATTTIPIIMASSADPVGTNLVASLAKPGGNVTGVATLTVEIAPKTVELLHSVAPKAKRIAVLVPNASLLSRHLKAMEPAASKFGVTMLPIIAGSPEKIKLAFQAMAKQNAQALIQVQAQLFFSQRENIVALAASAKLPAIYPIKEYVKAGGLMSYGSSFTARLRLAANYVDKILQGAKPADLPVQQPTAVEVVINLKTARALGITFPQEILLRADEIIE